MAARRSRAVFTENFSSNLRAIEEFLGPSRVAGRRRLLERLLDDVVPLLLRFPEAGRDFLGHGVRSGKAGLLVQALREGLRPGDALRELVVDDYLILYLVRGETVALLAIRHHRQLSFDLARFWLGR